VAVRLTPLYVCLEAYFLFLCPERVGGAQSVRFSEIVKQAVALLQESGRVSYRALKREFDLDDETLEDLKGELIDIRELAADKDGKMLVWVGDGESTSEAQRPPAEQPATTPATEAQPPEAERRQITVMFCDLVGSTALAEKLDPEELRRHMQAYRKTCTDVITRYDGHVAQYLGDGVMVYFGWPAAHEDDAGRAVRAGLDIVDAVAALEAEAALAVRIGIATGLVVVGESGADEGADSKLAVGETPNIAARIQGLAEPGTVAIAETTRRLLGSAFALEDLGSHDAKGVSGGLNVHRVLGAADTESRFEASQGVASTPLVGRETEIALLMDRWRQAMDGEGQVVLLSGEAGIGKSRVTQVLREMLADESYTRLRYQCSPYYVNSAFSPIIDQIERAAGFDRDDKAGARLDKLEAVLAQATDDVAAIAPLFAAMLSLPIERYPPLKLSPQKQKDDTIAALADQTVLLSRSQPVLMIFEDAHWADPTSLETLGAVIARIQAAPVLLVITCRPEFEPPWSGHAHVTTLTINRLSRRLSADMVARVTGGKPLPDDVLDQIVAKTDGVPLFVEELTKTVLEAGLLRESEDAYVLDGPLPPLAIPATLQDSLMARLDRRSPVKELAQMAAAIGREFSYELLAAISPFSDAELRGSLQELVNAELIFRRGAPPHTTYTFKHALVQDAAYESLLKSRRQQLHTTIAKTLAERFADRLATEPELAAHHYTNAGLNKQAIPYWLLAGEQAVGRFANQEASAHLRRGLALLETLPENRDRDEQELEFRTTLGIALISHKGYGNEECGETYARALEICERLGDTPQILPVLSGVAAFYCFKGDYAKTRELAHQSFTVAESSGDAVSLVLAHALMGIAAAFLGEATLARTQAEAGLALYDQREDRDLATYPFQDPAAICGTMDSWALWLLGYPDQAATRSREWLALTRDSEHPLTEATLLAHAAIFGWLRRDVEATRTHAEAAIELSERVGITVRYFEGLMLQGWADAEQGRTEKGITRIRQGVDGWRGTGAVIALPCWLALLAQAHRRNGQVEEAISILGEAFETMERFDERIWEPELHRLMGLFQLEKSPPSEKQAEACFEKAIEVAKHQQAKSWELRAAISLACLWQQQDKQAEAHKLLSEVYNWFTEGFDTKDLKDAKALLEELA
jgi:class 3 adenylate cyclase/predicted ATPase/adenylylsulfate kinase-like enzyme